MTLNQMEIRQGRLDPQEVRDILRSMTGLLHSPIQTKDQAKEVQAQLDLLSNPAERKWIAGRVATLLSQYFASSVPAEFMTAIAEDWHEELKHLPSWAIQRACRWWVGSENPDRRKKPMPGDISARARREMGGMKAARLALERFGRVEVHEPLKRRTEPTPESKQRMQAMVDEAFPRLKRFGGEA